MFDFLNSSVLFAAVAALIPLIIHLFSKRRVKTVEFSSLKYLKAMQRRQVRRLKIRQLLLLILRMAIILAVVLAFARPTVRTGALGSHAGIAAAVVMDNSASMSRYVTDGRLFDLARTRAHAIMAAFGEQDQVAVIPVEPGSLPEQSQRFYSPAVAAEQLDQLAIAYASSDLSGALGQAVKLLAEAKAANKELYLVTDRQRLSLPPNPVAIDTSINVVLVNLQAEPSDNCGITGLSLGGELIMPGHEFQIVADIANYSGRSRDDLIASLWVDGERQAQADVSVEAGGTAQVRFSHTLSRTGFHSGRVELSDDDLLADNNYYFSMSIPERFNILIVAGDQTADFVELALVPAPGLNQYWSVKKITPEELGLVNVDEYDVLILAGAPPAALAYVERIGSFVQKGKSVLMTYGATDQNDQFNLPWSDLTGVVVETGVPRQTSRAGYYTFGDYDAHHPIFSVFQYESGQLPSIKFYAVPEVRLADDTKVLMRFSGNRPALVERELGRGRVLTFLGPIDPEYSDLAGHAFFVPFISRLVEYLTRELSSFDTDLEVGQNITRGVAISGAISTPLTVTCPDSATISIPPVEEKGGLAFHPQPLLLPGVYKTTYFGREVDRFALNMPPREGDLARASDDQLTQALGRTNWHSLDYDDQPATVLAQWRYGRELWQLFLWIAVGCLAAEMILSRSVVAEEES